MAAIGTSTGSGTAQPVPSFPSQWCSQTGREDFLGHRRSAKLKPAPSGRFYLLIQAVSGLIGFDSPLGSLRAAEGGKSILVVVKFEQ